ncbi:MAG: D-alanine--D-alanine ligase [Candidatus Krumholzibacteriaceae bacterium]|jgi:D-alanine-D-alanine ligase
MRVAILFNAVSELAKTDELDVLVQLEAIAASLGRLGHVPAKFPCTLNMKGIVAAFDLFRPDVVFNLVECLDGHGRLIFVVPAVLDAMGVTYTGSPSEALFLTSHKVLAKERIRAAGLPTPDWVGPWPNGGMTPIVKRRVSSRRKSSFIVKSVWEHASFGMDDDVVFRQADEEMLMRAMEEWAPRLRGECFAEAFVDGREFNISIIATPEGPRVLPIAEIHFIDFPKDKPKIVGYRAKWEEESAEYRCTPRGFDFAPGDKDLLEELTRLSRLSWDLFALRGYARVDFRVDPKGKPYILEINANPCISPDSGFIAAAQQGGLDYDTVIRFILEDAAQRLCAPSAPAAPGRGETPALNDCRKKET